MLSLLCHQTVLVVEPNDAGTCWPIFGRGTVSACYLFRREMSGSPDPGLVPEYTHAWPIFAHAELLVVVQYLLAQHSGPLSGYTKFVIKV